MAAAERWQQRRGQCVFRLAIQPCPLRKLARKLRGKNAYNVPTEPSGNLSDHWRSLTPIPGTFPATEGGEISWISVPPPHPLPQVSSQPSPLGLQPRGVSPQLVQEEVNREPGLHNMDVDVDPETGEHS